ncbi:MAG: NADP-dependent oxidoreductase [Steroidobacteraceae bacterium]
MPTAPGCASSIRVRRCRRTSRCSACPGSRPGAACSRSAGRSRARRWSSRARPARSAASSGEKLKGCRTIGIAGGAQKCRWAVEQLGFDACLDYKAGTLRAELKAAAPKGVDVYFDNVGGEILDTVLARMNPFSRLPLCGMISQYNATEAYGVKNFRSILVNRITVRGFIVWDFEDRYKQAATDLAQWLAEGRLRYHETVAQGLAAAPAAFIGMLRGENLGKQLVKLV